MIIQALQAENLFKYSAISLSGLAEKGRIFLSGPNESGKTAVVEAICLGLFGRTVAYGASQLAKVVKWGENQASVTVTFLGRDEQSYSVFRYFDSTGQSQASLIQKGQEEPLVKGVEGVDTAVTALIGFGFQHYMDTLCLNQSANHSSTQEQTIKSLAGVADLDGLAHELDDEREASQAQIVDRTNQIQTLQTELQELNLNEEQLGHLEQQKATVAEKVDALQSDRDRWTSFVTEMQQAANTIEETALRLLKCDMETTLDGWNGRTKLLGQAITGLGTVCQKNQVEMEVSPTAGIHTWSTEMEQRLSEVTSLIRSVDQERLELAQWLGDVPATPGSETLQASTERLKDALKKFDRKRTMNSRFGLFALLVSLLVAAVGGVLHFQSDTSHAQMLLSQIQTLDPTWDVSMTVYLFVFAGIFLVGAMRGITQSFRLRGQINSHHHQLDTMRSRAKTARQTVQTIDAAANDPLARQIATLSQLGRSPWIGELVQWADMDGAVFLDEKSQKALLATLHKQLDGFRQEIFAYHTEVSEQIEAARQQQEQNSAHVLSLADQIESEKERRALDHSLRTQIADLHTENQHQEQGIAVRRVASDLLKGACKGLSLRFNQELRRFIAKSAPLFTQGRYQHVRIDEHLNVAVFSTDKNDFVDFNEISTGVRHQLLLAVRMALVQALTSRTNSAPQYIVLDEPFVFFDRQRIRESLDALLKVSDQIVQVWIVAQEFEEGGALPTDLHLPCLFEEDSLVMAEG